MKFIYYQCDICHRTFNVGALINNILYPYSNTFDCLEGHTEGQKLKEINYILSEYMSESDICPNCILKINNYVNLIESGNVTDINADSKK